MRRLKSKKAGWDRQAVDVLANRVVLGPGALVELIREVNPTGRGRAPAETAARYAMKAALQSMLVQRFSDDLAVSSDRANPGLVVLRHRSVHHDACHAVVADLDEDARAWVQRELDLATWGTAEEPQPVGAACPVRSDLAIPVGERAGEGTEDELVRAGERALQEYDYEAAKRLFAISLVTTQGGIRSAVAALSLAVEELGQDEEALSLESDLPLATREHPDVAVLLAIAAARSGDEVRALKYASFAGHVRTAEPLVVLARRALNQGDAEHANQLLRRARDANPSHPDLHAVAGAIAAHRAAERAPLEAQLAGHLATGADGAAAELARAILSRWPESESARRAAHEVEERERAHEARGQLAMAADATTAGDVVGAIQHLERALRGGLHPEERLHAQRKLSHLLDAQRAAVERERVEHVCELFRGPDRAAALSAYSQLEEPLKPRVRDVVHDRAVTWLDQIQRGRRGSRGNPVAAVMALERATELSGHDAVAALRLLEPHWATLGDLGAARRIETAAKAKVRDERGERLEQSRAERRLAAAELASGAAVEALAHLKSAACRDLPEADRAEAVALRRKAVRAAKVQRHSLRMARLRAEMLEVHDDGKNRAAVGDDVARSGEGGERGLHPVISPTGRPLDGLASGILRAAQIAARMLEINGPLPSGGQWVLAVAATATGPIEPDHTWKTQRARDDHARIAGPGVLVDFIKRELLLRALGSSLVAADIRRQPAALVIMLEDIDSGDVALAASPAHLGHA